MFKIVLERKFPLKRSVEKLSENNENKIIFSQWHDTTGANPLCHCQIESQEKTCHLIIVTAESVEGAWAVPVEQIPQVIPICKGHL